MQVSANDNTPISWSPQQSAFISWAASGRGSCNLIAVAGAGKTTTAIEAIMRMPGQTAYLAFNKKIAEEAKGKLKKLGVDFKKAQAGTVHSFGFSAFRKQFPKVTVSEHKVANLFDSRVQSGLVPEDIVSYASNICQLVSLAKQRAIGILQNIDNRSAWFDIIEHFDLLDTDHAIKMADLIVNEAIKVLRLSNADTSVIDFDDMVYMPVLHRVRFWRFDNVVIDEAQDTNAARRCLVRALVKPGGRVIAIGDPCQAIYGFTGADSDSLDLIKNDFDSIELPLTVTYRCPKKVVQFARQWVSHIEAHETAPEGSISTVTFEDFMARPDLDGSSAVLCRNTKPLVETAFALIRQKIPCRIEGREVGNGLKKLATRWKSIKTINGLDTKLAEHLERNMSKLLAKKQEQKAQELEDQVETLRVIMDACREEKKDQVSDVEAHIDEMFADNVSGMLTLSTIHKSKGREWQRVFWLDRQGTCPSKYARQAWQIKQENNLCYVAATRAMSELIELQPSVGMRKKPGEKAAEQKAA
jgi:DNA helicase-2/ATP-dependent DNA helicase PcrA